MPDSRADQIAKLQQSIISLEKQQRVLDIDLSASIQPLRELLMQLRQTDATAASASLSGSGTLVQGADNIVASGGGVAVNGGVQAPITTGGTYIAQQNVYSPTQSVVPPESSPLGRSEVRYRQKLAQRCNVLPLAALGGDEDTTVDVGLDRVYIDLDTLTNVSIESANTGHSVTESRIQLDVDKDHARFLSALEVTALEKHLVLLGDPGSGKSTFVRQLTVWLAEGKPLDGWEQDLTPVFTTLRDLSPRLATFRTNDLSESEAMQILLEVMWEQWRADLHALRAEDYAAELEERLSEGRTVLIFDGLDEVPERTRGRVRETILAVLHAYPRVARIIITCRIRSYAGVAILPGFTVHTLAPFDEKKIEAFVQAWYTAQADLHRRFDWHTAAARAEDLRQASLSVDLRELSSNPMLLTTMAIIHQREVGLPHERVRLYSLAVQVLINRWQKRKGISVSTQLAVVLNDDLRLRVILERVAYEAHRKQSTQGLEFDLSRRDLLALLEAPEYLSEVGLASEWLDYVEQRAGMLVGQGGDGDSGHRPLSYAFPHRTFQEYLAGCYMISERGIAREYWRRVAEGDYWHMAARLGAEELLFMRRNTSDLLDLAYDLCPAHELLEIHEWRATLWSGQIAALLKPDDIIRDKDKPGGGLAYSQRLKPRLIDIIDHSLLKPTERADAGRALGHLGDLRPEILMINALSFCYVPPGPFWRGSTDEAAVYEDEKPHSLVTIEYGYWLSRFLITNAQFMTFVNWGGYDEARYWSEAADAGFWHAGQFTGRFDKVGRSHPYDFGEPFNLPNHPVVGVAWYEALAFTRWLTEQWRLENRIPGRWIVRLPSENEWEKAARGGCRIPSTPLIGWPQDASCTELIDNPFPHRAYPWGDGINSNFANYNDAGINTTSTPGCFALGASPYGIQDMSGNVYEWCATKGQIDYRNYLDDNDLSEMSTRVMRGGASQYDARFVRCACRDWNVPNHRSKNYGFRICVVPETIK